MPGPTARDRFLALELKDNWLDGAAGMNRGIGRIAGRDIELTQQLVQPQPLDLATDTDAERAIFIMRAHRDDRTLETRIANPGHRKQELAGQERRRRHGLQHNVDRRPRPCLKTGAFGTTRRCRR